MILDRYPGLPDPDLLRDNSVGPKLYDLRAIGYWANDKHPHLPNPNDFVDPSWNANERDTVFAYQV